MKQYPTISQLKEEYWADYAGPVMPDEPHGLKYPTRKQQAELARIEKSLSEAVPIRAVYGQLFKQEQEQNFYMPVKNVPSDWWQKYDGPFADDKCGYTGFSPDLAGPCLQPAGHSGPHRYPVNPTNPLVRHKPGKTIPIVEPDYRTCPRCKAEQEYGGISGIGYKCKSIVDVYGNFCQSPDCRRLTETKSTSMSGMVEKEWERVFANVVPCPSIVDGHHRLLAWLKNLTPIFQCVVTEPPAGVRNSLD